MKVNILAVGDISGQAGVDILSEKLRSIKKHYDIAAIGARSGDGPMYNNVNADMVICSDGARTPSAGSGVYISCGMSPKATLSFSSVSDTDALLSINRDIPIGDKLLQRGEKRVALLPKLSLYDNLVLNALSFLSVGLDSAGFA